MRRLLPYAPIATACAAFAFILGSAAQAQAPKFDATGVYNCPVTVMHRCEADTCETRKPEQQMEISINFDTKIACMRRGGGDCTRPRPFSVVESGAHLNLIFSEHSMLFRLAADGKMVGGDIGASSVVTVMASCARG
jgi:hypothetical protein